ncbi:MAG: hypothetical protein ABEH40_03800 [Haloferacaceae archaeon]
MDERGEGDVGAGVGTDSGSGSDANADADAGGRRPSRTAVAYALFLSVPVAVGVWGALLRGTGRGPLAPVVIGPSVGAALLVSLLVLAGATGGTPDPDRRGPGNG